MMIIKCYVCIQKLAALDKPIRANNDPKHFKSKLKTICVNGQGKADLGDFKQSSRKKISVRTHEYLLLLTC